MLYNEQGNLSIFHFKDQQLKKFGISLHYRLAKSYESRSSRLIISFSEHAQHRIPLLSFTSIALVNCLTKLFATF